MRSVAGLGVLFGQRPLCVAERLIRLRREFALLELSSESEHPQAGRKMTCCAISESPRIFEKARRR